MSADRDTVLPARRRAVRQGRVPAGRASPTRAARSTASRCTCRSRWFEPMWLENLLFAEPGEGWRMVEDGVTATRLGDLPVNMSGGVLSTNPIGRQRHDPLRRGRHAGAGPGRRAPGRRRPAGRRSRLRRRVAVLRHVGRRRGEAVVAAGVGVRRAHGARSPARRAGRGPRRRGGSRPRARRGRASPMSSTSEGAATAEEIGDGRPLRAPRRERRGVVGGGASAASDALHVLVNNAGVLGPFTPIVQDVDRRASPHARHQPDRHVPRAEARRAKIGRAAAAPSSTSPRSAGCGARRSRRRTRRRSGRCAGSRRRPPSSSGRSASGSTPSTPAA